MSTRPGLARSINRFKLVTIEQHDAAIDTLIANGEAVEEPRPEKGKVVFSGIGCPSCGFRLMDIPGEEKTDPDGLKYRKCGCFRCGKSVWRRTP